MTNSTLTQSHIAAYARFLVSEERAAAAVEKYLRDLEAFAACIPEEDVPLFGLLPKTGDEERQRWLRVHKKGAAHGLLPFCYSGN